MQEVSALCDRIVILGRGRVVAHGTAAELLAQAGEATLEDAFVALLGLRRRARRVSAMRRRRIASVVARKELVDTLRDRRTMLVTLLTAIAAGPAVPDADPQPGRDARRTARASSSCRGRRRGARAGARRLPRAPAGDARQPAPADYEARIRSGDLDVVLVVDAGFRQRRRRRARRRRCGSSTTARATARARRSRRPKRCCARTTGNGGRSACCCAASRRRSRIPLDDRGRRPRHAAAVRRARAVPGRVLRALRGGDGRHGGGARHDRRRARARLARAAADDTRCRPLRARRRQVDRGRAASTPRSWCSRSPGFYLTLRFAPLPAVGIPVPVRRARARALPGRARCR